MLMVPKKLDCTAYGMNTRKNMTLYQMTLRYHGVLRMKLITMLRALPIMPSMLNSVVAIIISA